MYMDVSRKNCLKIVGAVVAITLVTSLGMTMVLQDTREIQTMSC